MTGYLDYVLLQAKERACDRGVAERPNFEASDPISRRNYQEERELRADQKLPIQVSIAVPPVQGTAL